MQIGVKLILINKLNACTKSKLNSIFSIVFKPAYLQVQAIHLANAFFCLEFEILFKMLKNKTKH